MKLSRIFTVLLVSTLLLAVCAQATDKEVSLFNFHEDTGGSNTSGYYPHGVLLADQYGNVYGTASRGGAFDLGTIFELTPNGSGGWNYHLLYTCGSPCEVPLGSLVMDGAGNLYGVSVYSNANVFEVSPDGSGGWTVNLVYTFAGGNDGFSPIPGLIVDTAGNLYGTAMDGGVKGQGYVFELSPGPGGVWTLTHLHDFAGNDGAAPIAGVIMAGSGNLYGTTSTGGASTQCTSGCGVVFELTNNSGTWTETVLHSFNLNDGSSPQAPLFMNASGNLYGGTMAGGPLNYGTVFEMSLVSGAWKFRGIHTFTCMNGDGTGDFSPLIMDAEGNLYGTTFSGGSNDCVNRMPNGYGAAFELSNSGGHWTETILHDFTGLNDGAGSPGLILGPGGYLYGVCTGGNSRIGGGGLIFELLPPVAPARK